MVVCGSRRYGSEDLALAEELAQRASIAMDNAGLFKDSEASIGSVRFGKFIGSILRMKSGDFDLALRRRPTIPAIDRRAIAEDLVCATDTLTYYWLDPNK